MRTMISLLTLCLLCGVGLALLRESGAMAAEQGGKKLRHIVMYKFKDGLPAGQIDEVVAAFAALPKAIDTVIDFEHGTNVSAEGKSEGFTHVFVVTFRDERGREAYLVHPAHLEYVKLVRDRREKVVVFDYWTGE